MLLSVYLLTLALQTTPVAPESTLLQYGVLGLAVLTLGWFAQFMFRRLIKEIDELRGQRDDMVQIVIETVPLIKQSNAIHQMRQEADVDVRAQLTEVAEVLRDVRRLLEGREL